MSVEPDLSDLPLPKIPACLQLRSVTKGLMQYSEAMKFENYRHAAHVCLWAPQEGSSRFGQLRAAVMMQLRFDGTFGFPGGLMNKGEDVVTGLNREVSEEIGWDSTAHPITLKDYFSTQVIDGRNLVLHFFIKQLTLEQFSAVEKGCPLSKDYGDEVMGSVRVPLYTMANMYNGLPAFINNKFVGSAKQQLLLALHHVKLFTEEEINEVILKSQNLKLSSKQF
ncbi:U8 snoRNA-decapping enzyme-like isoform X1 [Eriocheir sinensis]|uniref:U8 snoRNA-decapping enzyme-like isoform X1 n=2 Tax=Eriocheir sinensis TaxID=95602 RepID=UPI0021C659D3|nr:U8 snoRNA-decapping enzyme-like isoform X1 [Eriocheir sinensis]XP_050693700.1 U8 snoRNA-decapping enzyme-like isoform X1 [Eriocheir sinensis]XP_050693701.1 U8 snoRNA-decapping enzyme-like isoform X1 [Eriocheir sinensis]